MDRTKETYRQYMIGQLQVWESEFVRLKADAKNLEGKTHVEYTWRLRELEHINRDVLRRYADLLLAGEEQWNERQIALDAAAYEMQAALEEFALQPA